MFVDVMEERGREEGVERWGGKGRWKRRRSESSSGGGERSRRRGKREKMKREKRGGGRKGNSKADTDRNGDTHMHRNRTELEMYI